MLQHAYTHTHTHIHTPYLQGSGEFFLFQVFIEIAVQTLTDWTIIADPWPNRTGTSEATHNKEYRLHKIVSERSLNK